MINRYRTPVPRGEEVEAIQLTHDNLKEVATWCEGQEVEETDAIDFEKKYVGLNVHTAVGMMRASEGDYIVKGSVGHFYLLKPGAFSDMFEQI